MSNRLKEIADQADIIVNGYSFTREGELVRILNLNNPDKASVMDDIEICIVRAYLAKNLRFLEESDA